MHRRWLGGSEPRLRLRLGFEICEVDYRLVAGSRFDVGKLKPDHVAIECDRALEINHVQYRPYLHGIPPSDGEDSLGCLDEHVV